MFMDSMEETVQGKPMLFRALTTLIYPTKGDVKVDGKSILKEEFDLSQIGILIENPGFYPHLTGFENLEMLYRLNNEKNDKHIYDVLKSVGLVMLVIKSIKNILWG